MFLTREEVERLTGKRRFSAMRRALDAMHIVYKEAATGEPLVQQGALDDKAGSARNRGPRWDRLNEPA